MTTRKFVAFVVDHGLSLIAAVGVIGMAAGGLGADLPSHFDLRDVSGDDFVTGIRNQSGGTCWTHGTMAAMEGNLLMTGQWAASGEHGEPDLAEYHLDWWNGFNQHNNDDLDPPDGAGLEVHQGGDYRVASAYLTRGEGAVRDFDAQSYDNPPERADDSYHYFVPRDIEWLTAGEDLSTIDDIKHALMNHGVVATCMDYDAAFIDMQSLIHYQPATADGDPNHSIGIVGWDDTKAVPGAPGPGAWICKNSWGADWGLGGYFWISYYDKHCGKHPEMGAVSFQGVAPPEWDHVYFHDYHGWRDTYTSSNSGFAAFSADTDEVLEKVGIFTAADNVDVNVSVWSSFSAGELLELLSQVSGTFAHQGYHVLDLSTPVDLSTGEEFFVQLEVSSGGLAYDRSSEVPVLLGAESRTWVESSASAEESFIKSGSDWQDFTLVDASGNLCIKAMTSLPGLDVGGDEISFVSGPEGGPFSPDPSVFTLSGHGSAPISYEIGIASGWSWLSLDGDATGVLNPGENLDIHFSVTTEAEALLPGAYSAEISFINTDTHAGDTHRRIILLVGEERTLLMENMDTDPGWSTEGLWQWGIPQGLAGDHGAPDPSSGATGTTVYGYNLAGGYANDLSAEALTTTAWPCTGLVGLHLRFKRWLGVEQPQYDHAAIQISTDGRAWKTLWKNSTTIDDGTWVDVDLDISEYADDAPGIFIRWIMGDTDSDWNYCGWNLDDVALVGYRMRHEQVFSDGFESGNSSAWFQGSTQR